MLCIAPVNQTHRRYNSPSWTCWWYRSYETVRVARYVALNQFSLNRNPFPVFSLININIAWSKKKESRVSQKNINYFVRDCTFVIKDCYLKYTENQNSKLIWSSASQKFTSLLLLLLLLLLLNVYSELLNKKILVLLLSLF
jgi:hypothetical protein